LTAILPAPSTPSRTLSIRVRPSLGRRRRLLLGPECAPVPGSGDLIVVITQHGAQNRLGVLTDRGRLARVRELLADKVQWREELVRAHVRCRQEGEAVSELG